MEIVELCRERGAHLFCDEMYRFLEFEPSTTLPACVDVYEKVCGIISNSLLYTYDAADDR